MPEAPRYTRYGNEGSGVEPVLETSVVDLTLPEEKSDAVADRGVLQGRGAASPEEITRSHQAAHVVLDQIEAMLHKPTQEGGNE